MKEKQKISVVGAGVMGLVCAYRLLKKRYEVTLFEASEQIGGMASSFNFDGITTEKFYHFVCLPDQHLFDMLEELGIRDCLNWRVTKMGFFYEGTLYKWGDPLALLYFRPLDFISKMRYGFHIFHSIKRKRWEKLDRLNAMEWIRKSLGAKASDVLWNSLFELKFYNHKDNLSAAWIWSRLKRMGVSRKNLFKELLGYLNGGSQTLIFTLAEKISEMGGKIILNAPVKQVTLENGNVTGLVVKEKHHSFDVVVSTAPLPYIPRMVPELPADLLEKYRAVENIGVVCVILKLKHPLSENFWMNINDSSIDIPGIIEYTNLNPLSPKIAYFPFYLHRTHKNYSRPDCFFLDKIVSYCKMINPDFSRDWILGNRVHRYEYAQPVCPPRYLEMLPPIRTCINGLFIADTSYYYPEDRSISESICVGKKIADMIPGERQKDVE